MVQCGLSCDDNDDDDIVVVVVVVVVVVFVVGGGGGGEMGLAGDRFPSAYLNVGAEHAFYVRVLVFSEAVHTLVATARRNLASVCI